MGSGPTPDDSNAAVDSSARMAGDAQPAVAMRSITKRFDAATALAGVDITLHAGEIHALLGENGAGKSTLMHVLAGEIRPTSGAIYVFNSLADINSPRRARQLGIAMVHQHFMLAPALSVAENLALDATWPPATRFARIVASTLRFSARDMAAPALEQAKRLGWDLNPDAEVSTLSVGQQQRVEIVKALATNARILIFDEPTAVLNAGEIDELFSVLRLLRSENKAIVLIAHKLAEIMAAADRVTVLRKGRVVATVLTDETNAAELARLMVGDAQEATPVFERDNLRQPLAKLPGKSEPVCRATSISVEGSRGEHSISGLSLEVYGGEIIGIGGVDGNGQVELAEVLAGLRKPVSGELAITSAKTGYIPQDRRRSGLAVSMSVSDNLLFEAVQDPAFRFGPLLRMEGLRSIALSMIRDYDIRTPGANVPVSTLSGGNQQKIIVARALRSNPGWVVAINPTRGLDIGAARFVHDQLRKARDRGAAVIMISTDLDELAAIADRTAILSGGILTPYKLGETNSVDIGLLLGGAAPDLTCKTSQAAPA